MSYQGYNEVHYFTTYFLFFALLWLSKEKNGNRLVDNNGLVSNPSILIVLHIGGIILFGILPFLSSHLSSVIFNNKAIEGSRATWITVLLTILVIIKSSWIAKTKFKEVVCHAPLNTSISLVFVIPYFLTRIIFIGAYESWFRGYLLHDCIISFGAPLAILLNVGLYTLLHIVNGKEEVLACLPFGLLLCSLCIWQGAAWPAIVIHLGLAIPYEISLLQKIKSYKNAAL